MTIRRIPVHVRYAYTVRRAFDHIVDTHLAFNTNDAVVVATYSGVELANRVQQ